jgi:FkbM family methyltransferase
MVSGPKLGDKMQEFTVRDIRLAMPDDLLTDQIRRALETERYEAPEARALMTHLRHDDRVLELGAGAGFLGAMSAGIVGVANVCGVEASPRMVEVARANHALNEAEGLDLRWGAAVHDSFRAESVSFTMRPQFWGSSLATPVGEARARVVDVPAIRLGELLRERQPSVLICDIEGGELDLFAKPLPGLKGLGSLRLVVMEIHPGAYGKIGVKRIFDGLSAAGMTYCPRGSAGGTIVFHKVLQD